MAQSQEGSRSSGFADGLRPALEGALEASGADIVGLYPYDQDSDSFYAPISIGLPVGDAVRALPDLNAQLLRFRADEAEGKIPDDLSPANYGTSAWLVAMRKPLVSTDAIHEADSSFVRRHHIRAIIGLPLLLGDQLVGLLYFDYVERPDGVDVSSDELMSRIQAEASSVSAAIDAVRHRIEADTVQGLAALVHQLSGQHDHGDGVGAAERHVEQMLETILHATALDAAALYIPAGGSLHLSAHAGESEL